MRRDVPMSVRRLIVEVDTSDLNVTEFCAQHGVSTWFFYQLRKRFAAEGEAGLEAKSRAAKRVANRTPDWVEDLIVEIRKELADGGWDAGPATVRTHLLRSVDSEWVPSESTIWRILTRRGFVTPQPEKAPKHAHRRFEAERANECWQIDDFSWELADGTPVKVISLIDDRTRFCPGLKAVDSVNGATAFEAFTKAGGRYGWPAWFLSDNANHYRHTLANTVSVLGVGHSHGRPYHPQTQGKVERLHQTIQKWLRAQPQANNLTELQTQLDEFADNYNHQRPHRAIGRRTPAAAWKQTPKTGPTSQPLGTPTHIHRVNVTGGICHINKQYSITIGAKHNQQTATVIITGLACHVFINGKLIRQLTLDPTRRYQPLYDRPGKPV
jgi:transposase InsO family protein